MFRVTEGVGFGLEDGNSLFRSVADGTMGWVFRLNILIADFIHSVFRALTFLFPTRSGSESDRLMMKEMTLSARREKKSHSPHELSANRVKLAWQCTMHIALVVAQLSKVASQDQAS